MDLPVKRVEILKLLWRYVILRAAQIRDRLLPNDKTAANTRAHLRVLVAAELVRKYQPKIVDPLSNGNAPPIYTLTCKGASILAAITGDSKYILKAEVSLGNWMSINHWASLSSLAMILDDAFAETDLLVSMHFEHEVVDPDKNEPWERYLLYTKISEKLFFCPDMAFETNFRAYRRAWFVEYETGSDAPARVVAKKHKGVAGLGNLFREAFPNAKDFKVIAFCPAPSWRDSLRKEFKNKPGAEHWLFCSTSDLKKETFLFEPIMYSAEKSHSSGEKGPFSLLTRPTEVNLGR